LKRAGERVCARECFNDMRSLRLCKLHQLADRVSGWKRRATPLVNAMDAQGSHVELTQDCPHPADVVAVRVGHNRNVNVAGSVPVVEMLDYGISRCRETGVDHNVRQSAVLRVGEPNSYRVAMPASVAHWDEFNFPHARNLL
jgi:hypothetical protein